ncbi:peptidoglycan D,D-transpeptidase FtsI family protein [Melissococcus plutonius]|uniref:peptidoglycan D,D-transpeptidase FtsI family protein n=1 Tax=Melissococcus plutonius TaxID=33970 RepID=UPI00065DD195|nr:penicillin-binding protein 2 [Melissococcus plutonius]KMT40561.1 penicillin-binding protein 2X [Melissococcus plutonius]
MNVKSKIKKYIQNKNVNPMNNRKKVGIILFATSIGLFFLFAYRLTYITVTGKVAGESLEKRAKELYQGSNVIKAKRGTIFDRYGNPIAEDATSYSVTAILSKKYLGVNKKKLYVEEKNFPEIAKILNKYTKLTESEVLDYLNNNKNTDGTTKYQVEFGSHGKNLTLETKQAIEKELKQKKINGISFIEYPARLYPNGVFSSHFIGYTTLTNPDKDSEDLVGKMGLEKMYNDILSGKDGRQYYQKDLYGNPLPGTVAEEKKAKDGQDIYTTLDSRLQSRLESLLDPIMKKIEPEDMTAVLAKAKTGEILAMAQRPTFNPETKEGLDGNTTWRNIVSEDSFEPGSTMKIFTTAAAIQEGKFDPNATYSRDGGIKVGDVTINDHDYTSLGNKHILNYRQALSWSSNIGMVHLEERLGGNKWKEYMHKFGFGKSTNSGLENEGIGRLPGNNYVDQAMSSFGQATSVTSLQMMQAYTAIANDGTMLKPRFISKIVDKNTNQEKITPIEKVGMPIDAKTASTVREYMVDTVENPVYGIAYDIFKVPGYHISAKTGTAEITGSNGYLAGKTDYTYSVVEMMPSENPEYIFYLTIKRPKTYVQKDLGDIANPLLKLATDIQEPNNK